MLNYSTDGYINQIYNEMLKKPGLLNCNREKLDSLRTVKRKTFEELLGLPRIKAMAYTPVYDMLQTEKKDGYMLTTGHYTTQPGLTTPLYVLEPDSCEGRQAAYNGVIIYCHGHGIGALEVVDPIYDNEYQKCLPIHLARKGYKVLVPELVGFGNVKMENFKEDYEKGCYANTTQLLLCGMTMAGVRVHQIIALIDYITQNDKVKPVLAGISGGGLVASFTAALGCDIRGAFISGYVNTFKGSIMAMFHCIDNFVPNILTVGEEPEIIALACPTPLLISAGQTDPIFPIAQTEKAIEIIRNIYARFGAEDKIDVEIFNGPHEISENSIYEWLQKLQ